MSQLPFIIITAFFMSFSQASTLDWSQGREVSPAGNPNPYELSPTAQSEMVRKGYIHALQYPVDVSGVWLPFEPLRNFLESDSRNPLRYLVQKATQGTLGVHSMEDFYKWIGLNPFPEEDQIIGMSQIPFPEGSRPDYYMGATIREIPGKGKVLTFSCAACHTADLFGRKVMGLTNKRPQANKFHVTATKTIPFAWSGLFQLSTKATDEETAVFKKSIQQAKSIGAVMPQTLGLDTSLAQVALSLAKRGQDGYATIGKKYYKNPRPNALEDFVADSKPAVWWNVKYKNRFLSDGSVVSGNPIFTNILWNEIGRGTDLHELEAWMKGNTKTIQELTAAVFSTKPPRYEDFFGTETINLESAKRGENIYLQSCKKCHGTYEKAWSLPNASELSLEEQIQTTKVTYFKKTPVKHVGTDQNRFKGMRHFAEDLNRLEISKWIKTKVVPQTGYVPPPLEGIWSRYPYLHNGSIPNLCALMTPPGERPKWFYQGPAVDPEADYDHDCVGYPVGDQIPKEWLKEKDARYDTTKPGLSNRGHYRMFRKEGGERYTPAEKRDLRMFLKTL